MTMKRAEVARFLDGLAKTDPLRAWELGVQFSIQDRLTDVVYLLSVLAAGVAITVYLVLLIFGKV